MDKKKVYSEIYAKIMSGENPCENCNIKTENCEVNCEKHQNYNATYEKYIKKYFDKRK